MWFLFWSRCQADSEPDRVATEIYKDRALFPAVPRLPQILTWVVRQRRRTATAGREWRRKGRSVWWRAVCEPISERPPAAALIGSHDEGLCMPSILAPWQGMYRKWFLLRFLYLLPRCMWVGACVCFFFRVFLREKMGLCVCVFIWERESEPTYLEVMCNFLWGG